MPNGFRLDFNENLFEYVIVGGVVVAIVAAAIGCRSAVVWKRYYMHMLNKIRLLLTFHINTHIHDSFSFIATQIMQSTTTQVGVREKEYVGRGWQCGEYVHCLSFFNCFFYFFFFVFPIDGNVHVYTKYFMVKMWMFCRRIGPACVCVWAQWCGHGIYVRNRKAYAW